jgi:hypothetical protein
MYLDGTKVIAETAEFSVEGALVGDHDELDGVVWVRDGDEVVGLNGWLWRIEVVDALQGSQGDGM